MEIFARWAADALTKTLNSPDFATPDGGAPTVTSAELETPPDAALGDVAFPVLNSQRPIARHRPPSPPNWPSD